MRLARICVISVMAALSVSAVGCSKKITIIQFPEFWTPELKTVAVMPLVSISSDPASGSIIGDSLAAALMSNGTYTVYNRNHLESLLDEQDRQIALGNDAAAAAAQVAKIGKVQAMLVGRVTTYAATTRTERREEPQTGYDRNGNPVFLGNRVYYFTRNEANVGVTAALIRVPGGQPIHAVSVPVVGTAWAEGSPPKMDPHGCLASAVQVAVEQLVEQFAIVRKQITVKPARDFRTASEFYDGKWTFTDTFPSAGKMFVYLNLPPECDRNRFRLAVVRKDQREDIASMEVIWSKGFSAAQQGFPFDLAAITAAGGPGKYTLKFYTGDEPVMTRDFTITAR